MFEIFSCRKPFSCDSKDALISGITRGFDRNQIKNKKLNSILQIALNQNLNKRFHSAIDFDLKIEELKQGYLSGFNWFDGIIGFLRGSGYFSKYFQMAIILTLIILILILVGLIIFYER